MTKERVCEKCIINDTCPVKSYVPTEHPYKKPYDFYGYCMYFVCSNDGVASALKSMRKGNYEEIEIDGNKTEAVRFGTPMKPTEDKGFEFERLVDKSGKVIIKTPDGNYKYNGQSIGKVK